MSALWSAFRGIHFSGDSDKFLVKFYKKSHDESLAALEGITYSVCNGVEVRPKWSKLVFQSVRYSHVMKSLQHTQYRTTCTYPRALGGICRKALSQSDSL